MSDYLTLCQDMNGELRGDYTLPAAVTGQTGQLGQLVRWIRRAWVDIQLRHSNWRWMRVGFTLNTVADDDEYAYTDATDALTATTIARFSRWRVSEDDNPPTIYLQSAGVGTETYLTYIDWNSFKWLYRRGTQNSGYPAHISVDPQNNLVLGPKPNGIYVVSGNFQRGAQVLAANGDTPDMPSDFHDLIPFLAIAKYGYQQAAEEVVAKARMESVARMRQLEVNQLPEIETAEPLA